MKATICILIFTYMVYLNYVESMGICHSLSRQLSSDVAEERPESSESFHSAKDQKLCTYCNQEVSQNHESNNYKRHREACPICGQAVSVNDESINKLTESPRKRSCFDRGTPETNEAAFLKLRTQDRDILYADKSMHLCTVGKHGYSGMILHDFEGHNFYRADYSGKLTYTNSLYPSPPEDPMNGDRIKRASEIYGILLAGKLHPHNDGDLIDYAAEPGDIVQRDGIDLSKYNGRKWKMISSEDRQASSSNSTIPNC